MLNSILDRKPRKIHLDRNLITNEGTTEQEYIIDPNEIEKHCITHYQNAGLQSNDLTQHGYSDIFDLPEEWQPYYTSKIFSFQDEINNINSPFTLNELNIVLTSLPQHKEPGPSKITYEDVKYLHEDFNSLILLLYNYILEYIKLYTKRLERCFAIPHP